MNKGIKLSVKKKITSETKKGFSYDYEIKLNGQKVERGIHSLNLKMDAPAKPVLTIECVPDEIDLDVETMIDLLLQK